MIKMIKAKPISNDSKAIRIMKMSLNRETVSMDVSVGLSKKIKLVISNPRMIIPMTAIEATIKRCLRSAFVSGLDCVGSGELSYIPVFIRKHYTIADILVISMLNPVINFELTTDQIADNIPA